MVPCAKKCRSRRNTEANNVPLNWNDALRFVGATGPLAGRIAGDGNKSENSGLRRCCRVCFLANRHR
jgi:hypothetical protein